MLHESDLQVDLPGPAEGGEGGLLHTHRFAGEASVTQAGRSPVIQEREVQMKMQYQVTFDPETVSPKEIKEALRATGLTDGDIELKPRRSVPAPKAPKAKPAAKTS